MAAKTSDLVKKIIPLLLVAAVAAGIWWYVRQENKPKEVVLSGTLEARTVNVGSLVGGRVVRVHVDEGSNVVAGQVLVTLETETIDRQIAEQHAAIEASKAALAKALAGPRDEEIRKAAAVADNDAREAHRQRELFEAGITAHQVYENAATKAKASAEDLRALRAGTRREDIAIARAQVEQQERHLATLMKNHAETEVHSSVTGVVQSFGLRPGDLVAPNQTVAEILEASQLWVRVYVPETLLGLVRVGQKVDVSVDTFPNETFIGHVSTVASQGEYTPRNVQTRAQRAEQVFGVKVLVDPNPKLKAGMAAEIDLGVKGHAE
ncbi:MAG TPA: efflux RND transporter periplasmic adaptor subunit [Thermoanaerobaculia bacterium]|nr:efflux RND transporter periplasmic adaptor subunit [Thermoanaerobaculia bacterium]